MIERWKNDDGSETILVTDDPPRRSLLSRLLVFLGMTLLVIVLSALPLLLIVFGIRGLLNGEIEMASRLRGGYKLYGNAAIIAAWIHLAAGFGFFGFGFHAARITRLKWLVWLVSGLCVVAAIYRSLRSS
jgi:hypothetical protein